MTREESIKTLEGKAWSLFSEKWNEALGTAIDTMRKYQKIQEILKDDTYYEEYGNNAEKFIVSAICEVVEDAGSEL